MAQPHNSSPIEDNGSSRKRQKTVIAFEDGLSTCSARDNPLIDHGSETRLPVAVAAGNVTSAWPIEDIQQVRTFILGRLSGHLPNEEIVGLDEQFNKLYDILSHTISNGESNSCLIIGNRGTGKTMIIRHVIKLLEKKFNENLVTSNMIHKRFVVVYLNGLAQVDDRTALKEITRQLFLEQELDGKSFASFAESLVYLLSVLKAGSRDSVPIIFILEEFDLFAQHPKQALLYNLFDVAQSSQNPIAVVGATCRLDVMEMLEKRVKSRFSHRQIYLFAPEQFKDFERIVRNTLTLTDEAVNNTEYIRQFNEHIEDLFQDQDFLKIIRRIFDLTKDLRWFFKICFEPTLNISPDNPFLLSRDFCDSALLQRTDAKTELLKGVSLLELCLVIAMKKLLERDTTSFNFEMVYEEYKEFIDTIALQGGVVMKLYKKSVAFKALEHLLSFELVRPVESVTRCPKEYRMMKVMLEPSQITEAVLKFRDCPTLVKKWGAGVII